MISQQERANIDPSATGDRVRNSDETYRAGTAFSESSKRWEENFKAAFGAHHNVSLSDGCGVEAAMADALRSSLPTFQIGESGDGSRLRAAARTTGHVSYCNAIDYFVVEEQEHARLLALVLRELDQPLRQSHWTDSVFVFLRHRSGLRIELLVLLVAELVSLGYYQMLARGCEGTPLAEIFERIANDEKRHLEFHLETMPPLLQQWSTLVRLVVRSGWSLVAAASAVLVAVDHRKVFAAAGRSKTRFVIDRWLSIRRVGSVLF